MRPEDCIRAAIPGASDQLCEHIVWGRTPFPFKKLTARDFYRAAHRFNLLLGPHFRTVIKAWQAMEADQKFLQHSDTEF